MKKTDYLKLSCLHVVFLLIFAASKSPKVQVEDLSSDIDNWVQAKQWGKWYNDSCMYDDHLLSSLENDQGGFTSEEYEDMDLRPFMDSISKKSKIAIFRFKNSSKILLCLFLGLFCGLFYFVGVYHIACVNQKKYVFVSRNLFIALTFLLAILFIVALGLFFKGVSSGMRAIDAEKSIMCEAFRLPKTLLDGNLSEKFERAEGRHFIGLVRFADWVRNFRLNLDQIASGENKNGLEAINNIHLLSTVEEFETATKNFYKKYEKETIPDFAGNARTPFTIEYSLRHFMEMMDEMQEQYLKHAEHLQGVGDIYEYIETSTTRSELRNNLKMVQDHYEDLIRGFLKVWDDLLVQALVAPGTHVVDVHWILGIFGLFLFGIGSFMTVFIVKRFRNTLKKIKVCRVILMVMGVMIMVAFFLTMQAIVSFYTLHYTCGFLYKATFKDQRQFTILANKFDVNGQIEAIKNHCFISQTSTEISKLPYLIDEPEHEKTIKDFIIFLNGIKVVSDDQQAIDPTINDFPITAFANHLDKMKQGFSVEFDEMNTQLEKLNDLYKCSETFFSWSEGTCKMVHTSKINCVKILNDHFYVEECVEERDQAKEIFNSLKTHIDSEARLMDQMILDLKTSDSSLLNHLKLIWRQHAMIHDKLENVKRLMDTQFQDFEDGELRNWLDCSVIQEDLKIMYKDTCSRNLAHSLEFGNYAMWCGIILFFFLILSYALTILNFRKSSFDLNNSEESDEEDKEEEGKESGHMGFEDQVKIEFKSPLPNPNKLDRVSIDEENSDDQEEEKRKPQESFGLDVTEENDYVEPKKQVNVFYKKQVIPANKEKQDSSSFEVDSDPNDNDEVKEDK